MDLSNKDQGKNIRHFIIGDPGSVRTREFLKACSSFQISSQTSSQTLGPILIDYRLLLNHIEMSDFSTPGFLVRIESPGRDFGLYKSFLSRGAREAEEEGVCFADLSTLSSLKPDKGMILWPRQWYLGFRSLLRDLGKWIAPGNAAFFSHPDDIIELFDKRRCNRRLKESSIPTARSLGRISCFDDLVASMQSQGCSRIFLKLNNGSSGSGIVALQRCANRILAWTTVEALGGVDGLKLYNTRKLRRLHKINDISALIDALCPHDVHCEQWIPKAGLSGRTFDMRVLVIGGEPAHTVLRLSKGPVTNLHLLNHRESIELLASRMSAAAMESVWNTCRKAAQIYPKSLHIGLDIAITPEFKNHYVLEINAFGDLLKGIRYNGETTYEAEIKVAFERFGKLKLNKTIPAWI